MKSALLALPLALLLLACGNEPEPAPDLAALERLTATVETGPLGAAAAGVREGSKEAEVARVARSLEKLDVERVDPSLAEALIGR